MKKLLFLLFILLVIPVQAQEDIFLPVIVKGNKMAIDPRLVITDGTIEVDLLQGGWELADPYWNPQISQYKGGGSFVNAQLAEGRRIVHQEYDNVIETIPLSLRGTDQAQAMKTAHDALALLRQAGDYWTKPYEYDQVWLEVKLPCNACLTGYSRVIKGTIPELTNPFGQPSFSPFNESVMEGITLTIERDPFWQITKPGEVIGPLYNLIDNPDFELWNFGIADSQPDSWSDLETTHITGQNSRSQDFKKFGQSSLRIRVSGSTLAGATKGVTQIINDVRDSTEYTIIAWVRSEGVSNGVGRILINYASQLELYRSGDSLGWTLYTGKITTGNGDVVSINCEILTTAANTDGTIFIDGLMFIEGDWEQEAIDNVLPYLSGSHIVNHWDDDAGDINWVDVWHVPGNVDAPIEMVFINNNDDSEGSPIYEKLRIGMRRTGDVQNFDNFYDPIGVVDATASSGSKLLTQALTSNWLTIAGRNINARDNLGRFRVFARVYDTSDTLETRISYYVGTLAGVFKSLSAAQALVTNAWSIVDLTSDRAMNIDDKRLSDNAVGFDIQMRRLTGANTGQLDYILIMPTDGGFAEITFNFGLRTNFALTISNNVDISVASVGSIVNAIIDGNTAYAQIFTFNGYIYQNFMRYENGTFVAIPDLNDNGIYADTFAIYNGELHISTSGASKVYQSSDGLAWSFVFDVPSSHTVETMLAFENYLYLGTQNSRIYRWDGTSITTSFIPASNNIRSFAPYGGKLYAGGDGGTSNIYVYDPDLNSWSISLAGVDALAMLEFNGDLYAISIDGTVRHFDGNSWMTDITANSDLSAEASMEIYNNKLWIIGKGTLFRNVDKDGVFSTFTDDSFVGITNETFWGSTVNTGAIWAVFGNPPIAPPTTYTISETSIPYGIASDISISPFHSPARTLVSQKRHRFVFSYDRLDSINNIDDTALIGLSFVPRYLELPMKEN